MIRKFLLLILTLTISVNAGAQALPASRIGAEIAAVVKSKIAARGFAANDPRFGGTVSAVGTAVVQIATAVVVTGTAPAWGTVLATALIAGAVGYGIQALTDQMARENGGTPPLPRGRKRRGRDRTRAREPPPRQTAPEGGVGDGVRPPGCFKQISMHTL